MSAAIDLIWLLLVVTGAFFFTAGTLGLIRFPDVRSRLHALTKADNLGLGLIFLGVAIPLGDWSVAGVLLLAWVLALGSASVSAQALAGVELRQRTEQTEGSGDQVPLDAPANPADPEPAGPELTDERPADAGPRNGGESR